MKTVAVLCNVLLVVFTCWVTLAEGPPKAPSYVVFTLLLVLIPILNVLVILRGRAPGIRRSLDSTSQDSEKPGRVEHASSRNAVHIVAIACNFILIGLACWAITDQSPHPKEAGVIEFELVVILTPVISAVVMFLDLARRSSLPVHTKTQV